MSKPISKPISKNQYSKYSISYSSTSVPYKRYPSHIRADADHRRRRPSARSPLPPSNLATTAARQSGAGIARQSCGCLAGLSRQSGATVAAARQSSRLSSETVRQSDGLRETVRRDRRRGHRRTVWPRRARRRQPSQHKPARHARSCAPWPTNTACHPSRSPATARKSHRQ
jgi:hypothetical protein